jgi:transposase-like protein
VQGLLNSGEPVSSIAEALDLKPNTITKAITEGKLLRPKKNPVDDRLNEECAQR